MDFYIFILAFCFLLVLCFLISRCMDNIATSTATNKATVDVTGKQAEGHSKHVAATGMRADNSDDASKALRNTGKLNVVGLRKGTADTVEATGLDLRRSQRDGDQENILLTILKLLLPDFIQRIFGALMGKRKGD
ncbi:uncharacterized protein LOC124279662 isoform X2 [Haliotis rubra]|uniref:uncharacterized protein LOC124279662 isoform X2 n=1 Tax=Haliotis rubra TaxID=36100 RepID=UPI001EE5BD34|nr:uncharacterized protein LOC124279662 isoform X2 [Haliotis rubra]